MSLKCLTIKLLGDNVDQLIIAEVQVMGSLADFANLLNDTRCNALIAL